MLVKTFWTIANQSEKDVYYGLYDLEDRFYVTPREGYADWLEAGKAVEVEVGVGVPKLQIGFWKGKGLAAKVAGPQEVRTDRSVTLTAKHVVEQPEEAEFSHPGHVGPVFFLTAMEVNNRFRSILLAAVGKIPEVGGAIAAILGFLWKEEKVDVIAQSEERIMRWLQGRFEEHDRTFLRNLMSGLEANLEEYKNAAGPGERLRWLDIVLGDCNKAKGHFLGTVEEPADYVPGTIDLAVTLATIHITLLRERVVFREEIFGDETVNEESFRKTLRETIESYQTFIEGTAVPGELEWRLNKIGETVQGTDERFLTDWVTREVHRFRRSGRNTPQGPNQVCVDYYLEQAKGSLHRQLRENVIHTVRFWTLLDPEQSESQPVALDSVWWHAPLAGLGYMYGNEHGFAHNDAILDDLGRITEAVLWVADGIVGLQFHGEKRQGHLGGRAEGDRKSVKVPANAFLTEIETWFDFDLWAVTFHFSDGSSQGPFGKPERGGVHQRAELPRHHIASIGVGRKMQELRCGFTPLPDFYERLQQE